MYRVHQTNKTIVSVSDKRVVKLDLIPSPEAKLVHGDGKMSRLVVAVVEVAVVHRDQVNVTEDEAVIFCILQSLRVTNVQQLSAVESVLAQLQDTQRRI